MKIRNVSILLVVVAIAAVVVSLQWYSAGDWYISKNTAKRDKKFEIDFTISGNPSKLEITQPNCRIPGNYTKGCMLVARGWSSTAKFRFNGGNQWKLTKFQICKGTDKEDLSCDLNDAERREFAIADKNPAVATELVAGEDGSFDLTLLPTGTKEFFLFNYNEIKQNYFYTIQVCDGNSCPETDPPLVNEGRN